ncbi:MAG TPA: DUF4388 domain-containing protein [Vicinamibacteria bacterium]|nr:DUF4388 domain-containing protein [Vicinamibacteria bacterium]
MALTGNLRTMELPDVLQWISSGRKTGTLHLERRSVEKRIYFQEGGIYTSWSNDPRESMGQFLIRDRLVTEEELFKAMLRSEEEGRMLGVVLLADGVVGEEEIRRSLKSKAEESIYDLFLWPEGKFEFKDGEMAASDLIPIELEVTHAIMEGIRRVDEWARIRSVFPTMEVSFTLPRGVPADVSDPVERQMLELARSGRSLAAMGLEMRRSEFETADLAMALHGRGLLAPAAATAPPKPDDDCVGTIKALLTDGAGQLAARRFDQALEAYERVLTVDRLNQHAKKGLVAAIEARDRERTVKKVPLDKVPRLTMDMASLTRQNFDPQEGFVLSRVNGMWDVGSILKLCPMNESDVLLIFARLLERKVIELS